MNFKIINISFKGNKIQEELFDEKILKEMAFGSKISERDGLKVHFYYNSILIPEYQEEEAECEDYEINKSSIISSIDVYGKTEIEKSLVASIYMLLKDKIKNYDFLKEYNVRIAPSLSISDKQIGIIYSDGSFKRDNSMASYGVCMLNEQSDDATKPLDEFTGKHYAFTTISGSIEDGTNNIGELTGISKALDNLNDKDIQLIISDSIYSIKCFREWIYTWKNNNWQTYSRKSISNKELISGVFDKIKQNKKIILYKWTKSHVGSPFNELCDELAKKELGIEK